MDFNAGIIGLGTYLPEKRITKKEFIEEKYLKAGVTKESIEAWGVYEHRESEPDETPSDMSIKAARDLIKNTGINPKEIDLIIDSALVPDYILPGNSHRVQYELGAINAAAFDMPPAGGGIVPLLMVARSLILAQEYEKILITCSSKFSSVADTTDGASLVVGGDGAAAVLISKVDKSKGILSSNVITRGEYYKNSGIKMKNASGNNAGDGLVYKDSNGKLLFFLNNLNNGINIKDNRSSEADDFYTTSVPMSSKIALEKLNLTFNDVDFWITHQNIRSLSEKWIDLFGIRDKGNYYYSHDRYGNMFNVNVLVNLKEAVEKSLVKNNDIVVLTGIIVGLSSGSAVIRWGK